MKPGIRMGLVAAAALAVATPAFAFGLWGTLRGAPGPVVSQELGVEVLSLRRTANGHLIDLRYRVLDAAKAAALLDRSKPMELVEDGTGRALPVMATRLGPMRQTTMKPEAGRVYFALFANPRDAIKAGQRLTLKSGAVEIHGLGLE